MNITTNKQDFFIYYTMEDREWSEGVLKASLEDMGATCLSPENYKLGHLKVIELEEAILGLKERNIIISGIFTHHRNADSLSTDFYWQSSIFRAVKEDVKNICEELSLAIPCFHSCNSSALFRDNNFNEKHSSS